MLMESIIRKKLGLKRDGMMVQDIQEYDVSEEFYFIDIFMKKDYYFMNAKLEG